MPAYKRPTSSFTRALEHEMNRMHIDMVLYLNGEENAKAVLDDLIHSYTWWEVQTQETIDAIKGIADWLPAWCPDCGLTMTYVERDEGKRRCASCEALPYDEWCKLTAYTPDDIRRDGD